MMLSGILRRAILVLCVAGGALVPVRAADAVSAQEVKAVFLLNLTRFVRWPETAFPAEDAPLVIACLQDDPLGEILTEAAKGELAGKHPIQVRRARSGAELEGCHLVYFSSGALGDVAQTIGPLRDKPVLMVSDSDSFLRLGGHVQLFMRGGQPRLRLDVRNLKRAELAPSSQLLRVAEVVGN